MGMHFQFEGWPEFHKMWTAVRTKFIDDQLARVTAEVPQLVNLGAGLDTRAFRLDCFLGLEAVFEVDMEVINVSKTKILEKLGVTPICEKVEIVSLDFLDAGKSLKTELQAKGFNAQKPTVFVAEGLIQYLGDGRTKFLTDVSDVACKGSVFILQYLDSTNLGATFAASGISEMQLRDHLGTSWDFEFYKFGEDALNFGRYDLDKFSPNPMFSFMVAKRRQETDSNGHNTGEGV